jgi:hypothetical protein
MPRSLTFFINIPLNNNFAKIYFSAIKENQAYQDGAILIRIDHFLPLLKGFSYRIYPPQKEKRY